MAAWATRADQSDPDPDLAALLEAREIRLPLRKAVGQQTAFAPR
jgi:hypothetical protein